MAKDKLGFGTNTEGYLCVWDGQGTMHYVSASDAEHTKQEMNQAKILTMLFKIARKLKVDRKL